MNNSLKEKLEADIIESIDIEDIHVKLEIISELQEIDGGNSHYYYNPDYRSNFIISINSSTVRPLIVFEDLHEDFLEELIEKLIIIKDKWKENKSEYYNYLEKKSVIKQIIE